MVEAPLSTGSQYFCPPPACGYQMVNRHYKVQVLDRTCDILDCLASRGPELGIAEITVALGLSKTTVHRLVSALAHRDYVRKVPDTGKYRLSTKLVELGEKARYSDGLATAASPYLRRLVAETGETAHLGVLRDGEVVSICALESKHTLRTPATVGGHTAAHSSSLGKCLLADLDSAELKLVLNSHGLVRFTARTIVTEQLLFSELAKVRRQGYAIDEEEFEPGLKCVGVPVYDQSGSARAALGIAGPSNRMGRDVLSVRIEAVMRVAADLSAHLGYRSSGAGRVSRMERPASAVGR